MSRVIKFALGALCELGVTMPRMNYQGREVEAVPIDVVTDREFWNEYQLHDGTLLKMKLIVSEVSRINGEYDPEGNPVYIVKSGNVLTVRAPEELKRKKQ